MGLVAHQLTRHDLSGLLQHLSCTRPYTGGLLYRLDPKPFAFCEGDYVRTICQVPTQDRGSLCTQQHSSLCGVRLLVCVLVLYVSSCCYRASNECLPHGVMVLPNSDRS